MSQVTSKLPGVAPAKGGRTMVMGMALVGGLYAAFFINMRRRQENKEEHAKVAPGTAPTWSHRLFQAASPVNGGGTSNMYVAHASGREIPLAPPVRNQNNKHVTIKDYLASSNYSEEGRRQQPTPQRGRTDGSGKVYTKSPDYMKGYGKGEKN